MLLLLPLVLIETSYLGCYLFIQLGSFYLRMLLIVDRWHARRYTRKGRTVAAHLRSVRINLFYF